MSAGRCGFGHNLCTDPKIIADITLLENRYFFNRRILWQNGLRNALAYEGVFITEFNLRALSTLIIAEYRFRRGLPVVFWGHISGRSRRGVARLVRNRLLRRCNGFICYTHSQASLLTREFPRIPVWVAPNAICSANECAPVFATAADIADIVYVGRLVREKKPDLLLEGFAKACAMGDFPLDVRLIFCGEGPEFENLRFKAIALGINERVIFRGHVSSRGELGRVFATAICSVSPGYVGLSATLSFSFGVPLLIARQEPHSPELEACDENVNSIFFNANDAVGLALALSKICNSRNEWVAKRRMIADNVAGTYTFEKMLNAFVSASQLRVQSYVRPLKVLVFWDYYQSYHCSRIRALLAVAKLHNMKLVPVALHDQGGDSHQSEMSDDIASSVHVLSREWGLGGWHHLRIGRRLRDILVKEAPDVIFTPGYIGIPTWVCLEWAARNSCVSVLMFETLEHDRPRGWVKEALKKLLLTRYRAAITGGRQGAIYLEKLGMKRSQIVTGYDAVDNDVFASMAALARSNSTVVLDRLGLPPRFFLAVGRMIPKKGFLSLLQAYALYKKNSHETALPLCIIGDGPDMPTIKKNVQGLGISESVVLPGYKKTKEIAEYMALASVFIMPSVSEEQWGLVINEAMAAGIPVFASSICGATPELVVEGVTGFSFPPGDVLRLAELMAWGGENPNALRLMGAEAQRHVERYSLKVFADSFFHAARLAGGSS